MKSFPMTLGILFLSSLAAASSDIVYRIAPDPSRSSDSVTICRVTASNYSGASLDGRTLGFEAVALENGDIVERERGRFAGIVRNGETAETLIGFNGAFRIFDVQGVAASARTKGGSGRKASAGSKAKKSSTKKLSPKKALRAKTKKKAK